MQDIQAEEQHHKMLELAKNDSKLIYFRFDPELEAPDPTMEQLIEATDVYIDDSKPAIDRLLHLMEIKAGRLL